MTELITLKKYPKYALYQKKIGLYLPFKFFRNKMLGNGNENLATPLMKE